MASDRREIDEVRARTDVVAIIEKYVTLKRAGKNLKGLCPFHSEKTPSFQVNPDLGTWYCFGQCGEGGDVFKFVQKIENLTFLEALERLALRAGIMLQSRRERAETSGAVAPERSERDVIYRINALALRFYRDLLSRSSLARDYLAARGLAHAVQEDFALGFAPDTWDGLVNFLAAKSIALPDAEKAGLVSKSERGTYFDKMRGRLIFPIFDVQERPVAFGGRLLEEGRPGQPKYWNSPETPVFSKSRTLYGLHRARKAIAASGQAIVVEGYTDVLAAHQAGFENVVATLGTSLTEEHVKILARLAPVVLLAFDADSAGLKAAFRAGEIFQAQEVEARVLDLPEGEDPDSLLRSGRRIVFEEAISRALPLVEYRLRRLVKREPTETEADRVALFRKALPILASVPSLIERESYVKLLAPFHPQQSVGFGFAQEQIRQDVAAYGAGRGASASLEHRPSAAPFRRPAALPPGGAAAQAERHLLRALVSGDLSLAGRVLEEIAPDEFWTPNGRLLAAQLYAQWQRTQSLDPATLLAGIEDAAQTSALAGLLMETDEPLTVAGLDDDIAHLKTRTRSETLARMKSVIDSGEADSETLRQFVRLQGELKGSEHART